MSDFSAVLTIRNKILATLIQDARKSSGKTIEECSQSMGITPEQYQKYESGQLAPSLPEIETFAYFLQVPVEHFWGNQTLGEKLTLKSTNEANNRRNVLRNKIIGTQLRMARLEAGLTLEELYQLSQVETQALTLYELGEKHIPLPELEAICKALNIPVHHFTDQRSPTGLWNRQNLATSDCDKLPKDLKDFVCSLENRPYLELAKQFSQIPSANLQIMVEIIQKITR